MSQTGYTPIQLYRSSTASAAPSAGSLADGELAINTTDEKLYFKNSSGVVKLLASTSGGTGTVTSVAATGGTGISVTGSPITSSGTLTITNTAPDQVVSLTGAGTTTVTGTYPNFTITSNDQYAGTVTSVDASGGTTGLTFTGGPITSSGTLTLGGTLAVANGGTGATSLTSGYLVKGNGTSAVSASVVYDDGTNVGIGTTSPGGKLNVVDSSSNDAVRITQTGAGNALVVEDSANPDATPFVVDASGRVGVGKTPSSSLNILGNSNPAVDLDYYENGTGGASYRGRKGRGTASVPSAVQSGDYLSTLLASGYGDTGFGGNIGLIGFRSNQTFTDTARGTNIVFENTPDGSNSRSERMRIDSAGFVGIGTSAPNRRLTVSATGTDARINVIDSDTVAATALALTEYSGSDGRGAFVGLNGGALQLFADTPATNGVTISTGGSERMRIDSSGNVSIGTTTGYGGYGSGKGLTLSNQSSLIFQNASNTWNSTTAGGAVTYFSNNNMYIDAKDSGSNVIFRVNGASERMRIDSSGNVGIGTSSPTSRLTITGGVTEIRDGNYLMLRPSGNAWDMRLQATGTQLDILSGGALGSPIMSLVNGGNVGIGVTPGAKLDVNGTIWARASSAAIGMDVIGRSADNAGQIRFLNSAASTTLGTLASYGNDLALLNNTASYSLLLGTNSTERMRITSAGNVGIGTSSPQGLLHVVAGTDNTLLFRGPINYATGGSIYAVNSANSAVTPMEFGASSYFFAGGNVGIGTSAPGSGTRLNVSGRGLFTGGSLDPFDGTASGVSISYDTANNIGHVASVQTGVTTRELRLTGSQHTFFIGGTERMRIDSSGNVGIGTSAAYGGRVNVVPASTPTTVAGANQVQIGEATANTGYRLQLGYLNDATAGYVSSVQSYGGGSAAALILNGAGGNVGIGTTSPAGRLDISGNFVSNIVAVAASAIDCTTGNFFTKTATGALTWTITNPPSSRVYSFLLELTNGGTGTQTWFSGIKWPGGVAPTLTTSGVDVLGFYTDDNGTTWRGVQLMKDSK